MGRKGLPERPYPKTRKKFLNNLDKGGDQRVTRKTVNGSISREKQNIVFPTAGPSPGTIQGSC